MAGIGKHASLWLRLLVAAVVFLLAFLRFQSEAKVEAALWAALGITQVILAIKAPNGLK